MSLFSKEKELILKITNAILIIWLLAALAFTAASIINLLVQKPKLTYDEYKVTNCYYAKDTTTTSEDQEDICKNSYESYKINNKQDDYYNQKNLYISLANVVIVIGMMFLLNPKKEIKNNESKK